jgi:signal peptidase
VPRPAVVARYVMQVALAAVAVAGAMVVVVPRVLGWQGTLVLTGSMEPALEAGGVAFVDHVPAERIRVGDIMTFTRAGTTRLVTHRVIAVTPGDKGPTFFTRGDANEGPDAWTVTPKQVVGKVRFGLPDLGPLSRLLVEDRSLLALFMALPAAFLVADEVRRWRQQRGAVRRWLEEDRTRKPVEDEPLPPIDARPRRTRKLVAPS